MRPARTRLQVIEAAVVLLLFSLSVGCNGFFVDPTLTSITVGPANQNLNVGSTLQLSAVGTYSDGSTGSLGSGLTWSSSDTTVGTISSGGLITAVAAGTVTFTAAKATVTGTADETVVLNNVTSLNISPSGTQTIQIGTSKNYTCLATVTGESKQVDVTATVTWTIPNAPSDGSITVTNQTDPAVVNVSSVATSSDAGTYQLTCTYATGLSTSVNFTVP